jgi:hypothetical protein
LIWVALPIAVLALAGCGGDNKSEAETWADSVCSSIGDWRQEMSSLRSDLTTKAQNGTLNVNELRSGLDTALSKTETLVDELHKAGPPKTEAGQKARQKLDEVASSVKASLESARSKGESAGSLPAALAAVAPDLTQAASTVSSELQQIGELDPSGELRKAIDDTKSCQDLRS